MPCCRWVPIKGNDWYWIRHHIKVGMHVIVEILVSCLYRCLLSYHDFFIFIFLLKSAKGQFGTYTIWGHENFLSLLPILTWKAKSALQMSKINMSSQSPNKKS